MSARTQTIRKPRASGNWYSLARSLDAILFHQYDRIADDRPALNIDHSPGADRRYGRCRLSE